MIIKPSLIKGDNFEDNRGVLRFFNGFIMNEIKRMYIIEHPFTSVIRAWQGHQFEQKWFFVLEGSFEMHLVRPNDWIDPAEDLPVISYALRAESNEILHIPGGYASGFRALQNNSKILVFSDVDIQSAVKDDFRYDKDMWYKWNL